MKARGWSSVGQGLVCIALAGLAALGFSCSAEVTTGSKAEESAAPATDSAAATASNAKPKRHIARLGKQAREKGHLRFAYGKTANPDYKELQKIFKDERFFEEVVENLDQSLILPNDIQISLAECGEVDAHFDPEDDSVHLCYEMLEHFLQMFGTEAGAQTDEEFEEAGGKAVAALVFVFYHELGHALVDVYELPITGREEDAVDQLATVMLLETWEGEDSELAITASAEWFDTSSVEREGDPDMADEHSLDEQRYYNLLCWTYGSDPDYFSDYVEDWELPAERAERCPSEYEQISRAWNTLLGPHMVEEVAEN